MNKKSYNLGGIQFTLDDLTKYVNEFSTKLFPKTCNTTGALIAFQIINKIIVELEKGKDMQEILDAISVKIPDYPFNIKLINYGDKLLDCEFEASFPDFPNIVGGGDSAADALYQACFNLNLYIKDIRDNNGSIPTPSFIDYKEEKSDNYCVPVKCSTCGQQAEVDTELMFMSKPPMYRGLCSHCGSYFSVYCHELDKVRLDK